ncbi:MAG: alpha/beta hydrolase [Pirellulaceae bacterium]|nr:alpha/beta hydrolase [Pirellulaceae bacterium]
MNSDSISFPCVAALILTCSLVASTANGQKSQPNHKDVAYNDQHASQKLDVYLAKSDHPLPTMIFIHGGGWRGGSKNHVPAWLGRAVADGWMNVVSVEYRFTDVAIHPAQTNDCLRAIQFVRANASKWNVDPDKLGVTGGSAGGHLSLWVALHDDIAKADSDDAVARESSRVACAVSFAGPTDWTLLAQLEHAHPAYRQLLGYEAGTPVSQMKTEAIESVSPISLVSNDDPPIMQVHGDADQIVPVQHARRMHKALTDAGVASELVIIPDGNHSVAGAGDVVTKQAARFAQSVLTDQ